MSLDSIWQNAKDCYKSTVYAIDQVPLFIFRKSVNFYTMTTTQQQHFWEAWLQLTTQVQVSDSMWVDKALEQLDKLNKPVYYTLKIALKGADLTFNKFSFDLSARNTVEYHNFCLQHMDIPLTQIKDMVRNGEVPGLQYLNNPFAGLNSDQMFYLIQLLEFRTYGNLTSQRR